VPFTPDQFFEVFAQYNRTFWLIALAWWLGSAGLMVAVWRKPVRISPALTIFLGALWAWNAVAYHGWLFTRINPAAWLFALLFAVQAVLLFLAARRPVAYFTATGARRILGFGLVSYALAYPFLTLALGRTYPATPTFGVPCPTDLLTIGALLTIRDRLPVSLAIVPVVWSLVGGSAAVLFNVPTDFVLLGAGGVLAAALIAQGRDRRSLAVGSATGT